MSESATEKMRPPLELPSNATSIRSEITDTFTCENRAYGYYADVENECQIFHVCLPVMNADERKERTFRWSFICPEETVFSQVVFTCVRMEDMPNECKDSEKYYQLNKNFGMVENGSEPEMTTETDNTDEMQQMVEKIETTTDAKMIAEETLPEAQEAEAEKAPIAEEKPSAMVEMIAEMENKRKNDDMTQGLLPPLANEVYRAGTNGEAQMIEETEPLDTEFVAEETDSGLDEVIEAIEGTEQPLPVVLDLKESVIEAVENIVEEQSSSTEILEVAPVVAEARRIPGRRFLFRADARRNV